MHRTVRRGPVEATRVDGGGGAEPPGPSRPGGSRPAVVLLARYERAGQGDRAGAREDGRRVHEPVVRLHDAEGRRENRVGRGVRRDRAGRHAVLGDRPAQRVTEAPDVRLIGAEETGRGDLLGLTGGEWRQIHVDRAGVRAVDAGPVATEAARVGRVVAPPDVHVKRFSCGWRLCAATGAGRCNDLVCCDVPARVEYVTTSDGVRIAYAKRGRGPIVVWMPPLPARHVELEWEQPGDCRWLEWLAGRYTLV